jgi:hypothetical protein
MRLMSPDVVIAHMPRTLALLLLGLIPVDRACHAAEQHQLRQRIHGFGADREQQQHRSGKMGR